MSATDNTTAATASGLSAEDLELLTPEERAAIEAGADDAAEQEALSRLAADADEDDDGDSEPAEDVEDVEEKPTPAAENPAANEPPAGDEPAAEAKKTAPAYSAELPADFEQQQKAVADDLAALRQKFKDGEIELDAYEDQRDALQAKRDELNSIRTKAEIAQEMSQQSAQQAWQNAIARTFDAAAKPENGGIDYRKDEAKAADLDLFVKRLAEDPANADKDMDWFLNEGHRRVKALHGITSAPAKQEPQRRAPNIEAAPKTLAQVPGADGPGDVSGEFSELDALEGEALEDAIARLSQAQREKFIRGR